MGAQMHSRGANPIIRSNELESAMSKKFRTEKDSLGEYPVPLDAWYGIQTARAAVNESGGALEPRLAQAIVEASDSLIAGEHLDEFVVDRFQAGAGTSHNMNTNEVIANLANVALGGKKGDYRPVNPNDHVNMGQSTNDTIPAAIRLTVLAKLPALLGAVDRMAAAFEHIARQEAHTIKSGRTHLQDAVPTTIGREFAAYAWTLRRCADRIEAVRPLLCEIGLGGSPTRPRPH